MIIIYFSSGQCTDFIRIIDLIKHEKGDEFEFI